MVSVQIICLNYILSSQFDAMHSDDSDGSWDDDDDKEEDW